MSEVYYFGRGASNCIAAKLEGGNYAKIFIGNNKTAEKNPAIWFDLFQTEELVAFFRALRDNKMHDFIAERAYEGVPVEAYIEKEK